MKKTFLVLKYELITLLTRRTYLFLAFGIPLLSVLVIFIVTTLRGDQSLEAEPVEPFAENQMVAEGYVDQANLISAVPEDLPPDILREFASLDQADRALETGEIQGYYIIPADYLSSGEYIYVSPTRTPLGEQGQEWMMEWTLQVNLLGGDIERASDINKLFDLQVRRIAPSPEHDRFAEEDCSRPGYSCESNFLIQMMPMIIVILFFIFLTNGAGLLLRNVTTEKENRMVEILMVTIDTKEMIAGKLLGMGIASFLQVFVWLASLFLISDIGSQILNLPPGFSIPSGMAFWSILFFLLGYVIYASLMAGAGALVPSVKEMTSASFVVMIPLLIGYFIAVTPIGQGDPHGLLATFLSLFPLTTPVMMVLRLTLGGVPTWQLLLATALMILAAIFIVRSVASLFRAQVLLSGQPFSTRRFLRALAGRA